MRLKAHDKKVSDYSEIDKIVLIPKKFSEEFELGQQEIKINGKGMRLRVYDLPCNCNQQMHTHRVIDLRDIWEELGLQDGDILEIEK